MEKWSRIQSENGRGYNLNMVMKAAGVGRFHKGSTDDGGWQAFIGCKGSTKALAQGTTTGCYQ